ncbi:hypothetical protein FH008_13480, partial [Listeria monocytogenes]|nr:hypothetical protein [Listeria monocytogenes]EBF5125988.1 hypothetical protein [Listeria monocytogenes]EBF5152154.1 hypothetical protein [Listeria monocytogenes]
MRFSRKESEQKQKNWRMWKKGKQWLCGAALFFTVVSSPGMLVLADEVNSGDSTEVTAGEEVPPLPEGSTENEVEEATEEDGVSSPETATPSQQGENTSNTTENVGGGKKERPKQGRIITTPTAISDVFPDNAVAQTIRQILGATTVSDMITQSDLDSITTVTISYWGVGNISGMEHLTNLTNLTLNENPTLSDISPLSGLTKLTNLKIDSSNVSDISPLSGLTNLTSLSLRNNQISDISPLSGLTKLTDLILNNNQISDVGPLGNLPNLLDLEMRSNQISDVSPLSTLPKVFALRLGSNQISDISSLTDIPRLTVLQVEENHISDISGFRSSTYLSAVYQTITLSEKWSNQLEIPFTLKMPGWFNSLSGPLTIDISNGGEETSSGVRWTGLPNTSQNLTYSWVNQRPAGTYGRDFSGTATVRVIPVEVKILVDSDGDSQTTGDQTLLAEESDDTWNSLEDMYNYAKDQLNGTDYGLISIAPNSDGDYVILVSKVGSLKKEDASGTAVGTDVPYTPIYTVTGTGDDAELVVSYDEVVIDAPPAGYVYIYEKGTTQEARYTADTSIAIPLTDTNGNGIPQWKEDYTVKQYKKAGALHPSIPGGNLEVIGVPDDAVGGDIVTIPPDTITGSDGREYIVDPSIDIDPDTPGVQITLTEDEQDIPYLDVLLSESESTSASLSESESSSLSESESSSLSES